MQDGAAIAATAQSLLLESSQTMLVKRRTCAVKAGRMAETLELLEWAQEQFPAPHARRIYTSDIGTFDQLAARIEFESLEEYEKIWAEWIASPEFGSVIEKWDELTERGGTNEIWTLEQSS